MTAPIKAAYPPLPPAPPNPGPVPEPQPRPRVVFGAAMYRGGRR